MFFLGYTVIGGTLEIKEGASVSGLPPASVVAATESAIGGLKAATKGDGDTVEAKIGADDKLYVPTYPSEYTLSAATSEAFGGVMLAANQAASVAVDVAGLLTDFNKLLAALKTAGIMADDA